MILKKNNKKQNSNTISIVVKQYKSEQKTFQNKQSMINSNAKINV